MIVRKAGKEDIPGAVALARSLALDYPGMEDDGLWIAEEAGRIIGAVALKSHRDCLELCALGVDPGHRDRGVGRALVETVRRGAAGDVHLATVIPGYFEKLGFARAVPVPRTFVAKRQTAWCEGCPAVGCAVMIGRKP